MRPEASVYMVVSLRQLSKPRQDSIAYAQMITFKLMQT